MDWRKGIFVCLLVGFLQDPIRKLVPGQPVYFTVLIVPYILASLFNLILFGKGLKTHVILSLYPKLRIPFLLFAITVILQAIHGYYTTNNMVILGIGMLGYFAPFTTIFLAFNYVTEKGDIQRFLRFYIVISTIFMVGVFAENLDFQWPILGNVGQKLYFYAGARRVLYAGFLRSPEISAWHGAMAIMLCIVSFVIASPRKVSKPVWLFFSGIALFAIVLTGRRKGLAEIGVFIVIAIALSFYSRSRSLRAYLSSVIVTGLIVFTLFRFITSRDLFAAFDIYVSRVGTYAESPVERVQEAVVDSLRWVVSANGLWGLGAGTGSQGSQHFGEMNVPAGTLRTGLAAEGGLAKVLAELGIMGWAIFMWFNLWILRYFWRVIRYVRGDRFYASLTIGLVSILVANGSNFSVAHQAFGDPFVLLFLGFIIGFILAIPLLVNPNLLEGRKLLKKISQISTRDLSLAPKFTESKLVPQ
jgi:hypothetical protein